MADKPFTKKDTETGLHRHISGESVHPSDVDYIRTNIPCQWGCPASTNIPAYIDAIYRDDYDASYIINRDSNLFPGVLGRVCSRPCEDFCRHGETDLGEPVSICHLKRVAADNKTHDHLISEQMFSQTGKTVGVVGAGPAGLAVAHSLSVFGHGVTIYDALPKPGGMLLYGIPRFRLPEEIIDNEVFNITRLGIAVESGVRLGKDISIKQLNEKHDAIVVATGCYAVRDLGVPGEDLPGVHSGLEFMMKVNQGNHPKIGKSVVVIGGGFTAMDCARSSKRMGAKNVSICIRNVEEDLTVTNEEIFETKRENIKIISLVTCVQVLGKTHVEGVRFKRNRFAGIQGSGKRKVVPIDESEFTIPVDTVITAIGQSPEYDVIKDSGKKLPEFNSITGACDIPGVFGAGDFIKGASTVIEAIGHGREIAVHVDNYLMDRQRRRKVVTFEASDDTHRKRAWDFIPKQHMPTLPLRKRFKDLNHEVETGFDPDGGKDESKRCYLCNLKYEIYIPECIYCRWCIEVCPRDCIELVSDFSETDSMHLESDNLTQSWNNVAGIVIDSDRCIRCGECLRICPTQCIHVVLVNYVNRFISKEE